MSVNLIWAQAAGGVIGRDGAIPWHLPEDLANFRRLTRGASLIMGRGTWDSLPPRFRPLPERRNIVLTRDPAWTADGALVAGSAAAALELASDDVWVIGGGAVYEELIGLADRLVVTSVELDCAGDTFAPEVGAEWRLVDAPAETGSSIGAGRQLSTTGLHYTIRTYGRVHSPASASVPA